jgi:hypothetical protein
MPAQLDRSPLLAIAPAPILVTECSILYHVIAFLLPAMFALYFGLERDRLDTFLLSLGFSLWHRAHDVPGAHPGCFGLPGLCYWLPIENPKDCGQNLIPLLALFCLGSLVVFDVIQNSGRRLADPQRAGLVLQQAHR